VYGSITFGGGATQLSGTQLVIDDPLIYIGDNNVADITDLGIIGAYNNGTHLHTGLVRDASDSVWKLFSGMTSEPSSSTVDFTGVTYAPLQVGSLTSTIATGTAPLTVTSTTLVSNLNVDYLDGQHGSYYTTAGNLTGTISSTVLGNSTHYIGTTAVTLNRASANLALTGISSVTLPGSTSGTVQIIPIAAVGTGTVLTIPAVTGTIVTTGDTGTVTNTMLAGSIAITKLASYTISGTSLGNNLSTLTISTGLSGTSYNGSSAVTIAIDTATTVDKTTAQTLTNKSLSDSTTYFIDETDATKKLQFQLSNITTATTRTLTVPDVSGTIITTGDTGTVTSTMIADGTIVNGDISASAAIAITKLASSTISGVSLGSNLNTLTISAPLSGTSYNGSAAVSIGLAYTINQNLGTANAVQHSDITTARASALTTGYMYYGNTGTKYAGFDGTNFVSSMPMSFNIAGSSTSCTGNAATATTLIGDQSNWASYRTSAVANMLGWKNYSNGHVIFDASNGTSPTGSAVNNTNAQVAWSATYPTLMGWNASQTYGVRVDSARISDSTSGSSGSCTGNAVSATTATNQSGGYVSATTGAFSGNITTNSYLRVGNGLNASDIYMGDGDEGERRIHCNSNRIGFLNQSAGWGSYCNDDGSWSSDSTISGTNITTGGNVTGSSTSCTGNAVSATTATNASYVNGTQQTSLFVGKVCSTVDINVANDTGSISVRGNATYPASMSFHRTGAYAINVGLSNANNFVIGGWSASSNAFSMTGVGALTMLNNITAYSDERLKKNWRDLPINFVERLAEIKHGIYDRTDQECTQVGVSAQALQPLMPDAIMTQVDGMLSVSYGNAALVSAVQLAKEVVFLKEQVNIQNNTIKSLIEAIDELKELISKGK
jgi:hypothetical protein